MAVSEPLAILAALAALFAAGAWWRVVRSVDASGETVTGPNKRHLRDASFLLVLALALAAASVLVPSIIAALL